MHSGYSGQIRHPGEDIIGLTEEMEISQDEGRAGHKEQTCVCLETVVGYLKHHV